MTVFDPSLALEAFGDDREGLADFLRSVTGSIQARCEKLRQAVGRGDAADARAAAHALKGSSGHLGAAAVAAVAGEIENAARDGNLDVGDAMDRLQSAIAQLQEAVNTYLSAE